MNGIKAVIQWMWLIVCALVLDLLGLIMMAAHNPTSNVHRCSSWQAPITDSKITYTGKFHVRDKPGEGGFQFVVTENSGRHWYGLYWVVQYSATRAFVVRLGYKVVPADAGTVADPVGFTIKINPAKSIA